VAKIPDPIHTDPTKQSIDIRLYFPRDEDRDQILEGIRDMFSHTPYLLAMSAAYELVNDDFIPTLLGPADERLA
jgi:hypothetical protein